jgi:hypothetical protein
MAEVTAAGRTPSVVVMECMHQACSECTALCKRDGVVAAALSTPLTSVDVLDFLDSNLAYRFQQKQRPADAAPPSRPLSARIRSSALKTRLVVKLNDGIGEVMTRTTSPRSSSDAIRKLFLTCRCEGDDVLLYLSVVSMVVVR